MLPHTKILKSSLVKAAALLDRPWVKLLLFWGAFVAAWLSGIKVAYAF
jgi:hypothetical protein